MKLTRCWISVMLLMSCAAPEPASYTRTEKTATSAAVIPENTSKVTDIAAPSDGTTNTDEAANEQTASLPEPSPLELAKDAFSKRIEEVTAAWNTLHRLLPRSILRAVKIT